MGLIMNSKFKKILYGGFSFKQVMLYFLIIPVLLYFGLMLFAFFFAEKLIFQPQAAFYKDDDSIIKLQTESNEKISAKYFSNSKAEYTILFSHGNAEDIGTAEYFLEQLKDAGFSVFIYDYRGYGTSEGSPSEQNSYQDIETAYNYLIKELKTPPEKIIVHGRSLGGAVSIDLASKKKCGGLIVESSFVSAFRVMTKYQIFPFDKFQNIDKIKKVQCPVLFIHGKEDSLIPIWHGEKLFAEANEPKYSLWITEANHNDVFAISKDEYLRAIQNFSAKLGAVSSER
jgi:alpha-beta hydrolase superfamily lysophospholipase